MRIVDITNEQGEVVESHMLAMAEPVHRQLRPKLPENYPDNMRKLFSTGGRMIVAVEDEDTVVGVSIYRIYETTFDGKRLFIDDLVIDEDRRSKGIGKAMMAHFDALGQREGCDMMSLESGTHRLQTHKFYFREGMVITSFSFRKPIAKTTTN